MIAPTEYFFDKLKGSRHPAGAFALLLVLMGQGGQVVYFSFFSINYFTTKW